MCVEYVSVCCVSVGVSVCWCGCVGCAGSVAAGRLVCGIPHISAPSGPASHDWGHVLSRLTTLFM